MVDGMAAAPAAGMETVMDIMAVDMAPATDMDIMAGATVQVDRAAGMVTDMDTADMEAVMAADMAKTVTTAMAEPAIPETVTAAVKVAPLSMALETASLTPVV
jgi:hypothetical protein